jgi:hypothetical protein
MFGYMDEVAVGEQLLLIDEKLAGETEETSAKAIEIREILRKQTYVVETERGPREVVGISQISKVVV